MTGMTLCLAGCGKTVTDVRLVENYTSIDIDAVASVCFTQADEYAFRMEGSEELIGATAVEVKDSTLTVSQENTWKKNKGKLAIYISAPELKNVSFTGVGSLRCEGSLECDDVCFTVDAVGSLEVEDLHCRNLRLDFNGVGDVNMHVDCEWLEAGMNGVGRLSFSGKAGNAKFSRNGVGGYNVRNLKIGNK